MVIFKCGKASWKCEEKLAECLMLYAELIPEAASLAQHRAARIPWTWAKELIQIYLIYRNSLVKRQLARYTYNKSGITGFSGFGGLSRNIDVPDREITEGMERLLVILAESQATKLDVQITQEEEVKADGGRAEAGYE